MHVLVEARRCVPSPHSLGTGSLTESRAHPFSQAAHTAMPGFDKNQAVSCFWLGIWMLPCVGGGDNTPSVQQAVLPTELSVTIYSFVILPKVMLDLT